MTTAAKKAATPRKKAAAKPVDETPTVEPEVETLGRIEFSNPAGNARGLLTLAFDAKSTEDSDTLSAAALAHATLALAEEQRTANLIALLTLDSAAWRDLGPQGAGVDEEALAFTIAERLGLVVQP